MTISWRASRKRSSRGKPRRSPSPARTKKQEPRSAQVIDLAELLKQSLDKKGGGAAKAAPRKAAATRAKPALRVVAQRPRGATKTPAKRKRA